MEAMDNFRVHVIAKSKQALYQAIKLGCVDCTTIEGWTELKNEDGDWFILHWHTATSITKVNKFPTKLNIDGIIPIVEAWLAEHSPTDPEPGLDGSVSYGFELKANFGSAWSYEVFRIRTIWAEHHK